jgi:hypothetical protein
MLRCWVQLPPFWITHSAVEHAWTRRLPQENPGILLLILLLYSAPMSWNELSATASPPRASLSVCTRRQRVRHCRSHLPVTCLIGAVCKVSRFGRRWHVEPKGVFSVSAGPEAPLSGLPSPIPLELPSSISSGAIKSRCQAFDPLYKRPLRRRIFIISGAWLSLGSSDPDL